MLALPVENVVPESEASVSSPLGWSLARTSTVVGGPYADAPLYCGTKAVSSTASVGHGTWRIVDLTADVADGTPLSMAWNPSVALPQTSGSRRKRSAPAPSRVGPSAKMALEALTVGTPKLTFWPDSSVAVA